MQSRYYDPLTGRFINADSAECVTLLDKVISANLFAYCENNSINTRDVLGALSFDSLLSAIGDAFDFIASIAETAVCTDSAFLKLDQKIKAAKTRKARKDLMKQQKKLLISGTGKGLYYATKIIAVIVLVAPYVKYVLNWGDDSLLFAEFVVTIIIEVISALLCNTVSWLCKFIPVAGIIIGFAGSWLVGKLLDAHFNDNRVTKIAKYFNSRIKSLTSAQKWFDSFVYALTM